MMRHHDVATEEMGDRGWSVEAVADPAGLPIAVVRRLGGALAQPGRAVQAGRRPRSMKGRPMSERDETIDAPEGETLPLPLADDPMPAEETEKAAEDDDEGDDATEEATEPDA